MKRFFCSVICSSMLVTSAMAVSIDSSDSEIADNLVGDWLCETNIETPEFELLHQTSESFFADGTGVSHEGILMLFSEAAADPFTDQTMQLDLSTTAKWQVKDKKIVYSDNKVTVNENSDPELVELFGIDETSSTNDAIEIVEMSKDEMKLKLDFNSADVFATCRRKISII